MPVLPGGHYRTKYATEAGMRDCVFGPVLKEMISRAADGFTDEEEMLGKWGRDEGME
jgi:hypothetical protein